MFAHRLLLEETRVDRMLIAHLDSQFLGFMGHEPAVDHLFFLRAAKLLSQNVCGNIACDRDDEILLTIVAKTPNTRSCLVAQVLQVASA